MTAIIPGGYVIEAKCIDQSDISKSSPCTRELWSWLRRNVNHKDKTTRDGTVVRRGEIFTTYNDIIEALAWFKGFEKLTYTRASIEAAMKTLRKTDRITTRKTTRGMFIEVVKYDFYQNPANYEDHADAATKTTRTPLRRPHYNERSKEEKEEKNKRYTAAADEIIDYLNKARQVPPKQFKAKIDANRQPIIARLKEVKGEDALIKKIEDCKTIIDNMASRWAGTPQAAYLRTQTLFIPMHFNDYLTMGILEKKSSTSNSAPPEPDPKNEIWID